MGQIKKELTYKELREIPKELVWMPRLLLKSWGFDPDKPVTMVIDEMKAAVTYIQEEDDGIRVHYAAFKHTGYGEGGQMEKRTIHNRLEGCVMEEFKIEWNETPPHVLVIWDDASNVATWCDREDIEKHWGRNPHRCECVGYLIGEDKDGYYVAARAGMFNEEEDAWGLIERIPKGCVREIIPLYKQDNMTISGSTERFYEAALAGLKNYTDQLKEEDNHGTDGPPDESTPSTG